MNYQLGDIVTLKSHPLFKKHTIDTYSNQVPPLMIIKEVFFEDDKKKVFSSEKENIQIADNIKYTCIYFNNNKSEFVEATIYHSLLESYKFLKFDRKLKDGQETKSEISLITEVSTYKEAAYSYGKSIQLKTNKLERRKKFTCDDNLAKISFTSPDFVLCGYKIEKLADLFYPDGKPKKITSETFYKITWFNHFQQKFSEQYLPKEFFIEHLENEEESSDEVMKK